MALSTIKSAFSVGEISPSLYGRVDLNKWHSACTVARNFVVNFKGGLFSRAGTALVGICKQAASASENNHPRNVEFTFNIFQSYTLEFGDLYMRVIANGGYVTETAIAMTGASQANPCVIQVPGNAWAAGDWVYIAGVAGMTALNGRTFIAASVVGDAVTLNDVFGDPLDSRRYGAYTSGGTAARVYTLVTPYAAADLPYLKFAQSADVMSLCLVNQETGTDYAPQELTRLAADNWTIAPPTIASTQAAPTNCAVTGKAYVSGAGPAAYGYVVTAVAADGSESLASNIGSCKDVVDIAAQFGTNTVTWTAAAGADSYNIYRATPDYTNTENFTGQIFYYAGSSRTTSWQDTNIVADALTTPPLHYNPFDVSGNYPGVVAYFQQRRFYAGSRNEPDTYHGSQPGLYVNFDAASPPIDSDAITGTPWASQVNGIQYMLPMPGGLIVGTGKDSWQIGGTGGAGSPITPSQQNAQPQDQAGSSPVLFPIKVGYNFLYGQALGSVIREVNYNFVYNIYAGRDVTVLSSHLFQGFNLQEWAWSQEPWKVLWVVRDDGKMLAFTYVKDEEVAGWTRHDTNGLFCSVSTNSEPPANAVYVVVKRYIAGKARWVYCQERMDNRLWANVEAAWCVDSALRLPQPKPAATLTASRAAPTLGIVPGNVIVGGANYSSATTARIEDRAGAGSGAVVGTVSVAGGAVTGYVMSDAGSGYLDPVVIFTDATGSGAEAEALTDRSVTFSASAAVFASTDVGSVIRMGNGQAVITAYASATQVTANFVAPITLTMPNDPNAMPLPARSGQWTMTAPAATVGGLEHLEGMTVTGLADGRVIPPTVVEGGAINLPAAASAVTVGLPFLAQAQSMHADVQGAMIQGKRKRIIGMTVRIANTRGLQLGQDQPIAAATPNQVEKPWNIVPNLMSPVEQIGNDPAAGLALSLFTGDLYVPIAGDYQTVDYQASPGMAAAMQEYPLPAEILAFIPVLEMGDVPDE